MKEIRTWVCQKCGYVSNIKENVMECENNHAKIDASKIEETKYGYYEEQKCPCVITLPIDGKMIQYRIS